MSIDEKPSLDARLQDAVAQVAAGLQKRGMLKEDAEQLANEHRGSILVSVAGPIRVHQRGGVFYPGSANDPFGAFIHDLYAVAPASKRLGPVTDEEKAEMKRRLHSGTVY